jgi:hypothetical protein
VCVCVCVCVCECVCACAQMPACELIDSLDTSAPVCVCGTVDVAVLSHASGSLREAAAPGGRSSVYPQQMHTGKVPHREDHPLPWIHGVSGRGCVAAQPCTLFRRTHAMPSLLPILKAYADVDHSHAPVSTGASRAQALSRHSEVSFFSRSRLGVSAHTFPSPPSPSLSLSLYLSLC